MFQENADLAVEIRARAEYGSGQAMCFIDVCKPARMMHMEAICLLAAGCVTVKKSSFLI